MSLPEERAARNEALFREVNEQVRSLARSHPLPHKEELVIICECSDEHCMERISLRVALYEAVRTNSRHFIVVPGHDNDFERVLDSTDTYAIVEKEGRAGRIAERADPRG